jgi:hypothetical protein
VAKKKKTPEPMEPTINPLSGVFNLKMGAKKVLILLDKFEFEPRLLEDHDNETAIGLDVRVNGHYAGALLFHPETGDWFHLGYAQEGLFGLPVADPVGHSTDFAVALTNLLKDKWPDLYKEMVG